MKNVRALLYYVTLLLTVIPAGLACILFWPFLSARVRFGYFARPWMAFAIWAAKVICGLNYVVKGKENIPPANARILVFCKHQSAWETLFVAPAMPQLVGFIYKKSLHWIPFFGWAVKSMGMVGIDRSNSRTAFRDMIEKGTDFINKGWWIAIFPEGTRVAPGKTIPYKSGGARFALQSNTDILPIALNSGEYWPRNSFGKIPGTITVSIGPVIRTAGKTHEAITQEAQDWIESEMRRISAPGLYG